MTTGIPTTGIPEDAVAVIGMAGRFPGARNVDEYWANLRDGVETIRDLTREELAGEGVPEEVLADPNYVRRAATLDGMREFDAGFFGFTPHAARTTDPQQRLFIQAAWHALEDAGYAPDGVGGSVGVFATSATSGYLTYNLLSHHDVRELLGYGANTDLVALAGGSDKDYIATRVSHLLDLRGPSLAVQTACSSSLVAVHLAAQSVLSGECDLALAGGVSVRIPHAVGYRYAPSWIVSPDGHCRAFDAKASGTVFGSGLGVVALKPLDRAIADGDPVRAVIRGSAVNNDGALKMGFAAPSVEAQAEVIAEALAVAGVEAGDVGYIEAHGTGTALGDPVELAALTKAFAGVTERGRCAIGSVKSNIGHLEVASGIAGFIKTVLALQHRALPPTLHFTEPNPELHLDRTPFRVQAELGPWEAAGPLRAGVSSLGVGGTNAHVVLEEAPALAPRTPAAERPRVLLLSARTEEALRESAGRIGARLRDAAAPDLDDVAHTLVTGRGRREHRLAVVARDHDQAARVLDGTEDRPAVRGTPGADEPRVALAFPGQGAQHAGMAAGLYEAEPAFRDRFDACARLFAAHGVAGLAGVTFGADDEALRRTDLAQPALFAVEYALAGLLEEYGVRPDAVIGHSVGEYVAACLAGVFALPDAVGVIAARGRLMQESAPGAMLSVRLPEPEVRPLIEGFEGLDVAAINDPRTCVVAGPADQVDRLAEALAGHDVRTRRLATAHGFHSALMDPAVPAFAEALREVPVSAPRLPLLSNTTGTWMTEEEARDPRRWAGQIRSAVRFADGVAELLAEPGRVLVEAGPGRALIGSARRHDRWGSGHRGVPLMRQTAEDIADAEAFLLGLGRLWTAGVEVDWTPAHAGRAPRRISLPGYAFAPSEHWVAPRLDQDRRPAPAGLPEPEPPVSAVDEETDPVEALLAGVWTEFLGGERPARGDNFFDLGGDSVVAVQIAEKASARGLPMKPQDLFEYPSLGALADALRPRAEATAPSGPEETVRVPEGSAFPLTPLQLRALAAPGADAWCVPLLLRLEPRLTPAIVQEALTRVVAHHEALRLRVERRDGFLEQRIEAAPDAVPLPVRDVPRERAKAALAALAAGVSLDGPPVRAVYLRTAEGPLLALAVHHLAVDAASQRIVLADLWQACGQLLAGEPVTLTPGTTPWSAWAAGQATLDPETWAERDHWLAPAPAGRLPLGDPDGDGPSRQVAVELSDEETADVLDLQRAARVQVEEVLLAALAQVVHAETGHADLLVDVEGSARELPGPDLSRTVGSCTTVHPVAVRAGDGALEAARDAVRRVPRQGAGYGVLRYLHQPTAGPLAARPAADLLLAYLGHVDADPGDGDLLAPALDLAAPAEMTEIGLGHAAELRAYFRAGRLVLDWWYAPGRASGEAAGRLARALPAALADLVAEERGQTVSGYRPGDFDLAGLSRDELADVLADLDEGERKAP